MSDSILLHTLPVNWNFMRLPPKYLNLMSVAYHLIKPESAGTPSKASGMSAPILLNNHQVLKT